MMDVMCLWNVWYGGVYVKLMEVMLVNFYFDVFNCDIEICDGMCLMLFNLVYMMWQVMVIVNELIGVWVYMISFKLINLVNWVDLWESVVLQGFEKGLMEWVELIDVDGKMLVCFMVLLVICEVCFDCYVKQGYKIGDICGGISVMFDIVLFVELLCQQKCNFILVYLVGWLLVGVLILFVLVCLCQQVLVLGWVKDEQEVLVELWIVEL